MAEAAGLAIGVLGIAGLFTSCIENFNIIVRAREFSEEFELLCTQVRNFSFELKSISESAFRSIDDVSLC